MVQEEKYSSTKLVKNDDKCVAYVIPICDLELVTKLQYMCEIL